MKTKTKVALIVCSSLSCAAVLSASFLAAPFLTHTASLNKNQTPVNGYDAIVDTTNAEKIYSVLNNSINKGNGESTQDTVFLNELNSASNIAKIKNELVQYDIKEDSVETIVFEQVDKKFDMVNVRIVFKERSAVKLETNDYFNTFEKTIVTSTPISLNLPIIVQDSTTLFNIITKYLSTYKSLEEINNPKNLELLKINIVNSNCIPLSPSGINGVDGDEIISIDFSNVTDDGTGVFPVITFNNNVEVIGNSQKFVVDPTTKMSITTQTAIKIDVYNDITKLLNVNYSLLISALKMLVPDNNIVALETILSSTTEVAGFLKSNEGIIKNEYIEQIKNSNVSLLDSDVLGGTIKITLMFSNNRYATFNASFSNRYLILNGTVLTGLTSEGKKLQTIDLSGYTITEIGENCFANNYNLQKIMLPKMLNDINDGGFKNCKNLKFATFPNNSNLKTIGASAFENCALLYEFKNPSTINSLGAAAFKNCESLRSIAINEDTPINDIGASAFENCASLINFTIPNNVSKIERNAFLGCIYLKNLKFGVNSKLTAIEDNAFNGCSSITDLLLPSSITAIGNGAFAGCYGMKEASFNIGSSLTTIGENAFDSHQNVNLSTCVDLTKEIFTKIELANANAIFIAPQLGIKTFNLAKVTASEIGTSGTLVIDSSCDSVTGILSDSVKQVIKTINFGTNSNVSYIDSYAFQNCTNLTNIDNLPAKLISIGDYAFDGCSSLTNVSFEAKASLTKIGNYAFRGCSAFTNFQLQPKVVSIGNYAFENCTSLMTFGTAGNTVLQRIGISAFKNCTVLGRNGSIGSTNASPGPISLPASIQIIEDYAFDGCVNLSTIEFVGNPVMLEVIGKNVFTNNQSIDLSACTNITKQILISIKQINPNATFIASNFSINEFNLSILNDASVAGGILKIPSNIESIVGTIPTNLQPLITTIDFGNNSNLVLINSGAFKGLINLDNVNIPASVSIIADSAFENCSKLTNITIGKNSRLSRIGDNAFNNCTSLKSFALPATTIYIGNSAFSSCNSLSTFKITSDSLLTYIGNNAFNHCRALESIFIPKYLVELGSFAFNHCSALKDLTFAYDSELTLISSNAFLSCGSLTNVVIPSSVVEIQQKAFNDCSGLTLVKFNPNSQLSILDPTSFERETFTNKLTLDFSNCVKLSKESISKLLPSLGSNTDIINPTSQEIGEE